LRCGAIIRKYIAANMSTSGASCIRAATPVGAAGVAWAAELGEEQGTLSHCVAGVLKKKICKRANKPSTFRKQA
jgi:hypothetical protein